MCFKATGDGTLMKLLNIQIFPDSTSGWGSGLLEFGVGITQLFGPNGCGKSPVVQSIAFCLGFPCVFRNDIYEKCSFVVLNIETKKGSFSIKRFYTKSTNIEVTEPSKTFQAFYNEKDYSKYIFDLLDLKVNNLLSTGNKATPPYLSSMLPIFYLDQDEGYSKLYCSPNNFIKDQFSEMIRLAFSLPEKNSFNLKKNQIQAKKKLDALDVLVSDKINRLNILKETILSNRKPADLKEEIEILEGELIRVSSSTSNEEDAISAIEQMIRSKKKRIRAVLNELNIVCNRRRGLTEIKSEIETEINALSLNEEARRVFMSFGEICSSDKCQLFSKSSDSYAKNLLYLKDQIKDLENNDDTDKALEIELAKELEVLDQIVSDFQNENKKLQEQSEQAVNYKVISEIKLELFKLNAELVDLKKIEASEEEHIKTAIRRDSALNSYEAYKTGGKVDIRLSEFRKSLRLCFSKWLGNLKTSNISHDISFKDDFEPILGEESVNQLSGSTGSRTVLAFHAALLELAAISAPFRFLILDAPKQHETENIDLDRYMKALKELCSQYDLQVVFSATEYEYIGDHNDAIWEPEFIEDGKKMFMRKPK